MLSAQLLDSYRGRGCRVEVGLEAASEFARTVHQLAGYPLCPGCHLFLCGWQTTFYEKVEKENQKNTMVKQMKSV